MKIFLDTADVAAIERWIPTGLIDGVTTNPSHLSKAGGSPQSHIAKICSLLPNGSVSVEVTETEPEKVYEQAHAISNLSDTILVKVPCHKDYYPVIHKLAQEDVRLNITLVFTAIQGLMMSKLGAEYISPFVGRWDDIDVDGIGLLDELRQMMDVHNLSTGILAASLRTVRHLHDAILAGADAVTLPVEVFEKALEHPLTNQGIEKFNADWAKLGISQFP